MTGERKLQQTHNSLTSSAASAGQRPGPAGRAHKQLAGMTYDEQCIALHPAEGQHLFSPAAQDAESAEGIQRKPVQRGAATGRSAGQAAQAGLSAFSTHQN